MFVVDTNILLYAANTAADEHPPCRSLLLSWSESPLPWYSTWPIFHEFLRVITHPKAVARPWSLGEGWRFLEALLGARSFGMLNAGVRHSELAARTFREHPELRGNILHDAHTAVLMREHGIRRIYTRDKDFRRFEFLEALDPISGG